MVPAPYDIIKNNINSWKLALNSEFLVWHKTCYLSVFRIRIQGPSGSGSVIAESGSRGLKGLLDPEWDFWLDPDSIEYGSETLLLINLANFRSESTRFRSVLVLYWTKTKYKYNYVPTLLILAYSRCSSSPSLRRRSCWSSSLPSFSSSSPPPPRCSIGRAYGAWCPPLYAQRSPSPGPSCGPRTSSCGTFRPTRN